MTLTGRLKYLTPVSSNDLLWYSLARLLGCRYADKTVRGSAIAPAKAEAATVAALAR